MRRIILAVVSLLVLGGCQTTNIDYGTGPLTLSNRSMAAFEHYLSHENPTYFAIRADGRVYGYSVCNEYTCADSVGDVALTSCQRFANGQRCLILAVGRDVVWRGPISYKDGRFLGGIPSERPFIISWNNPVIPYGNRQFVRGIASPNLRSDRFRLLMDRAYKKRFGECKGNIWPKRGQFDIRCEKMGRVKGDYHVSEERGIGGSGTASDKSGRIVELEVIPASKFRDVFIKVGTN